MYYYDDNGNMLAEQKKTYTTGNESSNMSLSGRIGGGSLKLYQYDMLNRLIQYNDGETEAAYTYGADNLRASKTVNGTKTDFVWNGQNLAGETKNGTTNTYTYDMTGVHIANQNGNVMSYLKDYHGNVVAKANESGSMIDEAEQRRDYDAFGNQWQGTTSDPFGYCGEYYDSESGLIYLRNRYYDSTTGRFINEDPAKDGMNWYVYCGNNPIMLVDPNGLDSYILYTTNEGSDFSEQAKWQKEYLEKQGERVIMRVVNDYDSFIFEWNMIGYDYDIGESVSVNKVVIYSHGNDRTLILEDGSATKALSIDGKNSSGYPIGNLSYLEYKYVNELQILSCNAGNLDPYFAGVANVASIMSQKVSGVTYAYDGNVSFGRPVWQWWGEDIGMSSRLSTTQFSFNEIVRWYGHAGREPKGKLTYYNGEFKPDGYYPNTSFH